MEPKIRLKGYSKEWQQVRLGEIGSFKSAGVDKKINANESMINLLNYMDVYNKKDINASNCNELMHVSATSKQIQECNVLKGDIFFTPTSETAEDIGHVMTIEEDLPNTCYSYHLMRFRPQKDVFYGSFPNYGLESDYIRKQMVLAAKGVQRMVIGKSDFDALSVYLPTINEQKDISKFFNNLNALIKACNQKIESLKQVKVASLQAMFPQEGETTPRIRFKGFEGEWENKTLGECLTINNERNQSNVYGINDVLSVSDEVGVVNQIKLLGRSYAGKSVANYRVLKTNQIVYTKSPLKSKPYGIVKVNKGAVGIVSVLYAVYDTSENVYPDYIHYYFEPTHRINNYLLPLINKGAKNTMNISDEMALTGNIWIPSFDEQKKIADYLQALDSQIILQTQRLEKLKQIKSACLDNMFV